jgi:tRNA-specific 2-thiouridylase
MAPDGSRRVARGADPAKDQSYVLYMLAPDVLAHTELPVGELTKGEVRAHAARLGLRTAAKPDSMDVCFVARRDRARFVAARHPARPGAIVDTAGSVVGSHDGIAAFTVGQRRGVGVALGARRYVVDVDARTATVTLGDRDDLLRTRVVLRDVVTAVAPSRVPRRVLVQVRAHGAAVPAFFDGASVEFASPQPRVAPGQAVVLFDGDVVLGGGIAR